MADRGCCARLHLREDNARFILLAVVMTIYMVVGAGLFMWLERDNEITQRTHYYEILNEFKQNNPDVNMTSLERLLDMHVDAATSGILDDQRPRWDFAGSFYFVGTVVSTIGENISIKQT